MSDPFLSRAALARVLESLLRAELKAAIGGLKAQGNASTVPGGPWPDSMQLGEEGSQKLGCDSLDVLRLAAAVNEMFHLHEAGQERGLLEAGSFGSWVDAIEAAWGKGVASITFSTSGSTGKPKRCTHSFSSLRLEIQFLASVFAGRKRIVALTPAHHIYGFLFTALLPDALGIEVASEDGRSETLGEFRPGDLIVTFPERLQWLERSVAGWPAGVDLAVSTAPCPPLLLEQLHERGLGTMTEIYGSTETAGIGLRKWPETYFHLMPQWKIESTSAIGETYLRHASGTQVRVMDHLAWNKPGRFTVEGRLDGAVQVGGINVFPEKVAELLRGHPLVSNAAVRLMRPDEGHRLKAFVVPRFGTRGEDLRAELDALCLRHLSAEERPKSIIFGEDLPVNEFGKLQDW